MFVCVCAMAKMSAIYVPATLVAFFAIFLFYHFQNPHYVFSPNDMVDIARVAIRQGDGEPNSTITSVVHLLRERYPLHILPSPPWIFNNAGGAMGSMLVLHCSLIEYVIIFGTALGTEGHT